MAGLDGRRVDTPSPDEGAAFQRLQARDQELFPRSVRRSVLIALWLLLVVVFAGLLVVAAALAGVLR
jgi:hypothetical protein